MKMKLPTKESVMQGIIFLAILCSCIAQCIGISYTKSALQRIENKQQESRSVYSANAPMIASDAIYRLYECGGKIGIYDAKSEVLIDIIDVLVTTLPPADRLALKKGIDIYAFSDLAQIIEDFST